MSDSQDIMVGEFIARWDDAVAGVTMDADTAQELARAFKEMKLRTADLESALSASLRKNLSFDITRYLIANVRSDGAEKAERHMSMCQTYLDVMRPKQRKNHELMMFIHDESQVLTSHLDTEIGLEIGGDYPDYDLLEGLFFDRFIELCGKALVAADSLIENNE